MFGAAQFAKLLAARSEKNAPNGARFHGISFYRLACTERSRPFPTNLPKVRNRPVRFIDSLCRPKGGIPYLNSKLCTLNSAHGSPPPVSQYIKYVRKADTPNLLFIIYYLLFLHRPYARQSLHSPKQSPPPAENRQTGANQTYFTSSFGSKMFSKIATIAAGTMPEPPNTSRTASGVCARIPVLAPIP